MGGLRGNGFEPFLPRDKVSWVDMQNSDAMFLQRPFRPVEVQLAEMAKKHKKKLWVDYDDDLTCLPTDNPTYDMYTSRPVQESIQRICAMADVITVSTEDLAKKIRNFNKRVFVVPNGIDLNLFSRVSENVTRNQCIVWRGGASHFRDLHDQTDAIMQAYHTFPSWSFCWFGYNPTWITGKMHPDRSRYVPWNPDHITYMHNLQKMRGALHIVPLADHEFNRAKSRIAHLESSLAGSVCIAPDWREWQEGRLFSYGETRTFKQALFQALDTPMAELASMNRADFDWVQNNRSLEKVNKLRHGVLTMLQGGV